MSVYTVVSREQLEEFLQTYSIGELVKFEGISAGIENTNYFVSTTNSEFVLTLFESHTADELCYFLDLMAFLADHEVPSAHPIADNQGNYLRTLNDKPAALVKRLAGKVIEDPNVAQCAAIGHALGDLHAKGRQFSEHRDADRGPSWWRDTAERLYEYISDEDAGLLRAEIRYQSSQRTAALPRGVIHADLFRDNALFIGDDCTGIIDFYYACNDVLLYDLAVTVNDWCSNRDGGLDEDRSRAIIKAYIPQRPVDTNEHHAWQLMLRAAALRFWLSRLQDKHFPRQGEITHIKDPDVMKNILLHRINDNLTEIRV